MQAKRLWINSSQKLEKGFSITEALRKPLAVVPYFLPCSSHSQESVCELGKALHNVSWITGITSRKPPINQLLLLLAHQAAKHSDNASISLDQTFHSYPILELLFLLGTSPGEQIFPPTDSSSTAMCNRENNPTPLPPEAIRSLFNTSQHSQSSNAAEGLQIFLFMKLSKSRVHLHRLITNTAPCQLGTTAWQTQLHSKTTYPCWRIFPV